MKLGRNPNTGEVTPYIKENKPMSTNNIQGMTTQCCEKCSCTCTDGSMLAMKNPHCSQSDCPCHQTHTTKEGWEERWQIIKDGRSNSKYHKNYVAIHVAEDFLRSEIQKAQVEERENILKLLPEKYLFQDAWHRGFNGCLNELHARITNKQSEV